MTTFIYTYIALGILHTLWGAFKELVQDSPFKGLPPFPPSPFARTLVSLLLAVVFLFAAVLFTLFWPLRLLNDCFGQDPEKRRP